jgi:undecaprenyl-diphosphatase
MSFFAALLLALIQGVAEFLPVSGSGHLSILQNLLRLPENGKSFLLFDAMLRLGTLFALLIRYRRDISEMLRDALDYLNRRDEPDIRPTLPARVLFLTALATLPLFLGVFFTDKVELLFGKPVFVGAALVCTGVLLFTSERCLPRGKKKQSTMTASDAIFIGIAQLLALLPGLSRSGATIAVARARGVHPDFAVRFSLFMSVPAVIGSFILAMFRALRSGIDWGAFPLYLLALVVSGVVGYVSIGWLRAVVKRKKLTVIACYCVVLGAITGLVSLIV